MAEVKNAFIQSKMNKDLDDRLLPSGQYRNAVNAQVSKSEGSDVGALENVLGNALIADFTPIVATATVIYQPFAKGVEVEIVSGSILPGYKVITNDYIDNITVVSASNNPPTTFVTLSSAFYFDVEEVISFAPNLSSIGYLSDEFSNSIYIFLTDNITNSYVPSGPGSNHYIYKYDAGTNSFTKLVEGAFLNFSKLSPIFGVNLLEDLLFWTDNRNQPRKINVVSASQNSTYYTTEDQISVAKYYPHQAINLYKASSLSPGDYETTMKDVVSKALTNGGSANCGDITASSTVPITNLSIPIYPNLPASGFTLGYINGSGNLVKLEETITSYTPTLATTGTIALSGPVTIPLVGAATELVLNFNPYYENNYSGDDSFLEDKFVRFSYRFKFDDGEYSLIAPFTQVCFIPKQDGYFLNTELNKGDEKETFDSTIVKFMENKVNKIDLHIPLPYNAQDLFSEYHITEVDIVYKESDGLALQVVESVSIDVINNSSGKATTATSSTASLDLSIENLEGGITVGQYVTGNGIVGNPVVVDFVFIEGSTTSGIITLDIAQTIISGVEITIGDPNFFTYIYKAQKPYKTLPSNEVTRVYDKVPVKALAQEIISNRVVYGNFLNKNNPPAFLNYNVAATEKSDFNLVNNTTSSIEYPSSSVKTNRNYQIGFVLADKFGRQSTVILSNNKETITVGNINYSGSTLYSPYIDENIGANIDEWKGNSLKILLNQPITEGIYNGDVTSGSYNPTGWYSYKIVVKQTQQEYYNVYTAGALKGNPFNTNEDLDFTYLSLLNDNINKIPRDLSEVGPLQDQFRSSVRLFGRVEISEIIADNEGNEQFYPGKTFFTSTAIQNLFENFGIDRLDPNASYAELAVFQNWQSNPLLTQLTTSQNESKQFGIINGFPLGTMSNLVVLETAPVESRLDIFWETSTSGLISEVNDAVGGSANIVSGFSTDYNVSLFNEGIIAGEKISSNDFTLVNGIGANILASEISSFTLFSVFNTESNPFDASSYFQLTSALVGDFNYYNISVTSNFINSIYYGSNQGARVWNFIFKAVINGIESFVYKTISLNNADPIINPSSGFTVDTDGTDILLATITATNGASLFNPRRGLELTWSIISGNNLNYFSLDVTAGNLTSTCRINNNQVNTLPAGVYPLLIRVTDAGGDFDEITVTINSSVQVRSVNEYAYTRPDGSGTLYYFTVIEAVDGTNASRSGFYAYLGTWDALSQSFNIELDYTNASKNTFVCPPFSDFMFNDTFAPLPYAAACVTGSNDPQYVSGTPITFTGYTFSIV
jgi:hypothetical protein